MSEPIKKIDAVFEGGGVKGSALVGAVAATETAGYQFENIAGTSAGAIIAALLAAGYRGAELKDIMDTLDYEKFKDATVLTQIPFVGPALSLLVRKGIYKGNYFEDWLTELLLRKNVHTFKDLIIPEYANDPQYRYKLQVIASDITNGKLLVFPRDAVSYDISPDDLPVAFAVRMSMSIPYFFLPIKEKKSGKTAYIVDGGILSNFPVWLLDDGSPDPLWPTIGYKMVDPREEKPKTILGPITLFKALFETMMEAHDARYIQDKDFVRTVPIQTLGVQATDFSIDKTVKNKLYQSGFEAAQGFFGKWDFEEYKKKYRVGEEKKRTDRVWEK